jgi:hypothetical protein
MGYLTGIALGLALAVRVFVRRWPAVCRAGGAR